MLSDDSPFFLALAARVEEKELESLQDKISSIVCSRRDTETRRVKFLRSPRKTVHNSFYGKEAEDRLLDRLERVVFYRPQVPVVNSSLGSRIITFAEDVRNELEKGFFRPALHADAVRKMGDEGIRLFLAFGAAQLLVKINKVVTPNIPTLAIGEPKLLEEVSSGVNKLFILPSKKAFSPDYACPKNVPLTKKEISYEIKQIPARRIASSEYQMIVSSAKAVKDFLEAAKNDSLASGLQELLTGAASAKVGNFKNFYVAVHNGVYYFNRAVFANSWKLKSVILHEAGARTGLSCPENSSLQIEFLEAIADKLDSLAYADVLTGLFNRRYFELALSNEIEYVQRYKDHPLSLLMLDIDYFKSINDTYGHPAGDAILREIAILIKKRLRKPDIACRIGGEEIAVILPHTEKAEAYYNVAEDIRKIIDENRFRVENNGESGIIIKCTVSIGVAGLEDGISKIDLIANADEALYKAKKEGRNRIKVYSREKGDSIERHLSFFGHYNAKLDDKNRVIIPAAFTYNYKDIRELYFYCAPSAHRIQIYTLDSYNKKINSLGEEGKLKFSAFSFPATVDKQRRISICPELTEAAELERGGKVVFVGNVDLLEIWSEKNWDKFAKPDFHTSRCFVQNQGYLIDIVSKFKVVLEANAYKNTLSLQDGHLPGKLERYLKRALRELLLIRKSDSRIYDLLARILQRPQLFLEEAGDLERLAVASPMLIKLHHILQSQAPPLLAVIILAEEILHYYYPEDENLVHQVIDYYIATSGILPEFLEAIAETEKAGIYAQKEWVETLKLIAKYPELFDAKRFRAAARSHGLFLDAVARIFYTYEVLPERNESINADIRMNAKLTWEEIYREAFKIG
ncbi:MAG: diguanylate cyclase, partial [Candidatus Omnitrophica bacterium]|nr:diguanylate cyclase [Candidatus Omnitrophota bacterium]